MSPGVVREEHPENIRIIFVTPDVFHSDRPSRFVREEHPLNTPNMCFTLEVSSLSRFIEVQLLRPENNSLICNGAISSTTVTLIIELLGHPTEENTLGSA